MDPLAELRSHMDLVADRHDMQSLAEPEIAALDDDQIGAVFESLVADWQLALHHAPDDLGVCPADGEAAPCAELERLLAKYRPVG